MARKVNPKIEEYNKNKLAVALRYEAGKDDAPKVIAAGQGYMADRILAAAEDSDIPVHKDAGLAKNLSHLDIGESIPPELYEAVAEILVFIDRMDKLRRED